MKNYKQYKWIVCDPDLLGGKPTVKGTRISVSQILGCLADEMSAAEIAEDYPGFPIESIPDVLRFAAEKTDRPDPDVAA